MMPRLMGSAGGPRHVDARADAAREHHHVGGQASCRRRAGRPSTALVAARPPRRCVPVRTKMPQRSISRSSISPPSSSSWAFISVLLACTTVTCRPRSARTLAASRPSRPPPRTTALSPGAGVRAHAACSRRSCGRRRRPGAARRPCDDHARRAAAPAAGCRWRARRRRSGAGCRRPVSTACAAVSSRSTTRAVVAGARRGAAYQARGLVTIDVGCGAAQHLAEQDRGCRRRLAPRRTR